MTDEINRRDFMKRAALTTGGVSLSMAGISTGKVMGANDRIRLGVIGTGRQGVDDLKHFMANGVEVAAVCDVYEPNLDKGLKAAEKACAVIERFLKKIGMRLTLQDLQVPEEELAALAMRSLVLPDYKNHPKIATLEDIAKILNDSH